MGWLEDTRDGRFKREALCDCKLSEVEAERVHIMSHPGVTAIMDGEEAGALTVLDLSSIDLRNVLKQERFSVKTPRIFEMPEYA